MKPSFGHFGMFFIKALKYDAVRSILSRCEVLCEDVMDSQEEKATNGTLNVYKLDISSDLV